MSELLNFSTVSGDYKNKVFTVLGRNLATYFVVLFQNWSNFFGAFSLFPPLAVRGFFCSALCAVWFFRGLFSAFAEWRFLFLTVLVRLGLLTAWNFAVFFFRCPHCGQHFYFLVAPATPFFGAFFPLCESGICFFLLGFFFRFFGGFFCRVLGFGFCAFLPSPKSVKISPVGRFALFFFVDNPIFSASFFHFYLSVI